MDIYRCCETGNLQEFQRLIDGGVDVHKKNIYGYSMYPL